MSDEKQLTIADRLDLPVPGQLFRMKAASLAFFDLERHYVRDVMNGELLVFIKLEPVSSTSGYYFAVFLTSSGLLQRMIISFSIFNGKIVPVEQNDQQRYI